MIHLLRWLFGTVVIIFHMMFVGFGCMALSIIVWDARFFKMVGENQEYLIQKLF